MTAALLNSTDDLGDSGNDMACYIFVATYSLSFLGMVFFCAKTTASDPTDPTVNLERLARAAEKNNMAKVDFNPNDYQFHCDVCDTHVLKNTKHC